MNTEIVRAVDISAFCKDVPRVVSLLKSGGVIIFPTDTVYGIGGNAGNVDAARKIFILKRRDPGKSFLINVGYKSQIKNYAASRPRCAGALEKNFFPGALSIVYHASGKLPRLLTGKEKKIGIRIPAHPVALKLLRTCKFALISTSANMSGKPAPQTADKLYTLFKGKVDLIIDAGACPGVPSTLVDVTTNPPSILREGAIPREVIFKVLRLK